MRTQRKQTKLIIAGLTCVVFSWLFANLSVGSDIEEWYVSMSALCTACGLPLVLFGIFERL